MNILVAPFAPERERLGITVGIPGEPLQLQAGCGKPHDGDNPCHCHQNFVGLVSGAKMLYAANINYADASPRILKKLIIASYIRDGYAMDMRDLVEMANDEAHNLRTAAAVRNIFYIYVRNGRNLSKLRAFEAYQSDNGAVAGQLYGKAEAVSIKLEKPGDLWHTVRESGVIRGDERPVSGYVDYPVGGESLWVSQEDQVPAIKAGELPATEGEFQAFLRDSQAFDQQVRRNVYERMSANEQHIDQHIEQRLREGGLKPEVQNDAEGVKPQKKHLKKKRR